ncbi:MAG: MopE-related protein [Chitinophagales bacterium]
MHYTFTKSAPALSQFSIFVKLNFFQYLLLATFSFTSGLQLNAQVPEIEWAKSYGGNDSEVAQKVLLTADGGYYVVGYTGSNSGDVGVNHGSMDYWIIKLNNLGDIVWENTYGGSNYDYALSAVLTGEGGCILVGKSQSNDGDATDNHGFDDYFAVCVDSDGNTVWKKSYGGSNFEQAKAIVATNDGNYVIYGHSSSTDGDKTTSFGGADLWMVKINPAGNIIWEKSYGDADENFGDALLQTTTGEFILSWHIAGAGDYRLMKLSADGDIIWNKTYGGTNSDIAYAIKENSSGSFIINGISNSVDGDVTGLHGAFASDIWAMEINGDGDIIWKKCFGGTADETGTDVIINNNGNYVLAGISTSNNDGDVTGHHGAAYSGDYWIFELDASQNIIWQLSLGGTSTDEIYSIQQTPDNGYILAGWSGSANGDVTDHIFIFDFWIVKLSNTCEELTWYADADNDGFGNALSTLTACDMPVGYVANADDCNDANAAIFPGNTDICNALDDDCDGFIDEDVVFTTYYFDNDDDGFGDIDMDTTACNIIVGYVLSNTDCNDANATIHPDAIEICNDVDDNCNALTDEGLPEFTLFADADSDTFGNADVTITSCYAALTGYVINSSDCDDSNPDINPAADEICNALDDDCDGFTDENLPILTYYLDADSDTYGDAAIDSVSCTTPTGYVPNNTDCDDTNAAIYPGAIEILNGLDDNCDELIDEGVAINQLSPDALIQINNPVTNNLQINYHGTENINYYIITITGECIHKGQLNAGENIIDMSIFSTGLYFVVTNSLKVLRFEKIN